MRTEVHASITQIDRDEWNSIVAPDRLICRHEYLEAVENSRINDCRYFYPVVRDESGTLLAHTCLYFISTELDLFATGALKLGIQMIRKLWPSFLILRSLECGTPVALGNTISYSNGENAEILGEIVRAAEKVAVDIGVKVLLFRDFYGGDLVFYDQLQALGYKRIHNLPSVHMDVRWESYEAYLSCMRSQYRTKILAQTQRFESEGGSLSVIRNFGSMADELSRLWLNVHERADEYRRERVGIDFFRNIDASLGDRSAVILAWKDDVLVGFLLLLMDDTVLTPVFCGLDYNVNYRMRIYFNLFYRAVKYAIDENYQSIDLGITTVDPKIDLGGVVTSQYMYMRDRSPLFGRVVPALFDLMTPQPDCLSRNVFRKMT
jgi:predicted N-acyltransferase